MTELLAGVDSADGAANVDLVPATSQVQLHDTWAPPVADTAVPAAEPEPESDALAPVNAAAEPEQRISFYEGSVIAVWRPACRLTVYIQRKDGASMILTCGSDADVALALQSRPNLHPIPLAMLWHALDRMS